MEAIQSWICVFDSVLCSLVGRSGEDESQEDVLMDEAPSNMSQASTLQANREGRMWISYIFSLGNYDDSDP